MIKSQFPTMAKSALAGFALTAAALGGMSASQYAAMSAMVVQQQQLARAGQLVAARLPGGGHGIGFLLQLGQVSHLLPPRHLLKVRQIVGHLLAL